METMPLPLNREGVLLESKGGLKIQHLWTLLPFVFLMVVTFGTPLRLLDFWWHLKMGEVIVTTGSLPQTDIFSFTSSGKPFLLQSWLAEIFFYGLYVLGGFRLIVSGNAVLLALALLSVYSLCFRELRGPRVCALISLILIVPLVIYSNVRPQVFSILLFAFFNQLLSEFRWRDRDRLWLLPRAVGGLGQSARRISSGPGVDRDLLAGRADRDDSGRGPGSRQAPAEADPHRRSSRCGYPG